MPIPDRRQQDRRITLKVIEPLERKRPRRIGERRESPRLRRTLEVPSEEGVSIICEGDLSLGGVCFRTAFPPRARELEIRFTLPDVLGEVSALAEIVRTQQDGAFVEVHARFIELELKAELALARFVESRSAMVQALDDAPQA